MSTSNTPDRQEPDRQDTQVHSGTAGLNDADGISQLHSHLLAVLNHDLRSPMTGIVGMLGLLLESELDADQRRLAQAASNNAEQHFQLLRNVVASSRIDGDASLGPQQSFDLLRQIEQVIHTQTLPASPVQITTRYSGTAHAMVQADPSAISQVLCNLIEAALSADEHCALQIDIDLQVRGNKCRLSMRIFGTDDRCAGSPTASQHNDVRLTLTHHLLQAMGGACGIEVRAPAPDQYWLTLELPLLPSPVEGIRLLFVEADADRRSDREAHLSACGIHAVACADIGAAMKALAAAVEVDDPFRIMLLEQQMHGIDGEATGKLIAADPVHHATRLVMLSPTPSGTTGGALTSTRLGDAGFSAWLQQPYPMQTLISTLAQLATAAPGSSLRPLLTNVPTDNADSKDALASVRDLFGADFAELAHLFRSDSRQRLTILQRAVEAGEAAAVAQIAHTLSGSTVSIGATHLSRLCQELERHCKTGTVAGVAARMQAIENEYHRVDGRLRAIVAAMGA